MSYTVSESYEDSRKTYVLRVRVRESKDGLEIWTVTPQGTLKIPVDEALLPLDPKYLPIEFPMVLTASTARPGIVWLPERFRRENFSWDGNETRGALKRQQWKVIEVVGSNGMPRYYELDTGILVDFRTIVNDVVVSGRLVSAQ